MRAHDEVVSRLISHEMAWHSKSSIVVKFSKNFMFVLFLGRVMRFKNSEAEFFFAK